MRAIVIDDERLARKELINLLNQLETVEVVGEAVNVMMPRKRSNSCSLMSYFWIFKCPKKPALIFWKNWITCLM